MSFFWILINLILLLFLVMIVIFMTIAIAYHHKILVLIPLILVSILLFFYYNQLSNQFSFAKIKLSEINILQPLKFKIVRLKKEEIIGYSTSKVYFGRNLFYLKTFIIYTDTKEIFEIIKIYNFNFDNLVELLKKSNIKSLGKEPYQTAIYKRKYKYNP